MAFKRYDAVSVTKRCRELIAGLWTGDGERSWTGQRSHPWHVVLSAVRRPTANAFFAAVSRVARQCPVYMSARNQRLHGSSTCTWCAAAPAANGVDALWPWRDLVAAGRGQTAPWHGVLATAAPVWSLVNRRAQNYSSLSELISELRQVASWFQRRVCS